MWAWFQWLFDTSNFPARWSCGRWSEPLGWTHVAADLATFGAYTAIPLVLAYFVLQRRDVPFTRLFWLFGAFIFACGSVHLIEAIIFWEPIYRVSAVAKVVMAAVSWATVIALIRVAPAALRLPGLAAVNERLEREMSVRIETERQLRRTQQHWEIALRASNCGFWEWDLAGNRFEASATWLSMLGYEEGECRPSHALLVSWAHPDDANEVQIWFDQLIAGTASERSREFRIRTKDGTFLWILSTGRVIEHDSEGVPLRIVGTLIDISAVKTIQAELEAAKENAEALAHEKTMFLAIMSHEVRTPLNGILGIANILREDVSGPERVRVEELCGCAEGLRAVVNNVLDFTKLEAGRLELEQSEFSVRALFDTTVSVLAPRLAGNDLEVTVAIDPEVPDRWVGDEGRLLQVLLNLASNAVKFTERGHVTLTATLNCPASREQGLMITVADSGIGIEPEKMSRLFQPFIQADPSIHRRYGGTGLGLSISKRLIEHLGGALTVSSEPGRGSVFTCSVPLRPGSDEPGPAFAGHDVCAVIVAERAREGRAAHGTLAFLGIQAEILTDPDACEELAWAWQDERPEARRIVVWLTYDTPASAACHRATRWVEGQVFNGAVVALATEGQSDAFDRFPPKHVALIPSPIRFFGLRDALGSVLDQAPRSGTERTSERVALQGRVLIVDDNTVNQTIVRRILESCGLKVDLASDGEEALAACRQIHYDAILMDCRMPRMDGFEATRRIRQFELRSHGHTPIVALTAQAMESDRDLCLSAGMDDFLTKPIDQMALITKLHAWLDASGPSNGSRAVRAGDRIVEDVPDAFSAVHIRDLLHSLRPQDFERILDEFIRSGDTLVHECAAALQAGDRARAGDIAHKARGPAASLGLTTFSSVCRAIESDCNGPRAVAAERWADDLARHWQGARDAADRLRQQVQAALPCWGDAAAPAAQAPVQARGAVTGNRA